VTLPRRIVVIAGYAPSLVNFRGPLLQALQAEGHQVIALAPGEDPEVEQQLARWGIHYRSISLERTGMNPRRDLLDVVALTRILQQLQPDLVLAYTIKPVTYGLLAAQLAGKAQRYALITGLGYSFQGDSLKRRVLSALTGVLYRAALMNVRRAIFQNPDDRDLFLQRNLVDPSRVVVVNGSGVDLAHYTPAPLPQEPVFLLVARLLREKGIVEYVQAARELGRRHPEARFLLAGPLDPNPGSISALELQAWVKEGNIEYLGVHPDIRPIFAQSNVYVLPSYREGTPRTVLEAMAIGRAVITTDAPGCRETVTDRVNGLIVPVADTTALIAAMEQLLDPALRARMGQESLRLVREKYSSGLVNRQMLKAMHLTESQTASAATSGKYGSLWSACTKRGMDIVLSAAALVALGLPMLGLGLIIRLKLGRPVLFRQMRPGRSGKPFTLYKFRTMRDATDAQGRLLPDTERLTPLGRFLRSTSLDELPELYNVLQGKMSLVGPRPLLMEYLAHYTPEQTRRHEIRPGITGWAQVNGRNAISWEEKFKLDVWYVDNHSFWLDLNILWTTVQKVFKREGISAAGEATMPVFTGSPEPKL